MGDKTGIEWTDASWNPIVGCSVVSPGCTNCYAMKDAGRRLDGNPRTPHYAGTTMETKGGRVWTGRVAHAPEHKLLEPIRWQRPRRIFVNSMGDLFHESVPDEWIDKVFAVMALAPRHTFQVLTKRSARMREYMSQSTMPGRVWAHAMRISQSENIQPKRAFAAAELIGAGLLPHVWLGVSAEDQARADERIPDLLATPAAVRFVSAEPLLGPIDMRPWLGEDDGCEGCDDSEGYAGQRCHRGDIPRDEQCPRKLAVYATTEGPRDGDGCPEWGDHERVTLDWVIVGGESGLGARLMQNEWALGIVEQCRAAGIPVFVKQLSGGGVRSIKEIDLFPPDLRVREYPRAA
jgi:protein gp37